MEGDISTKSKKGRKSGSKGRPNKAQGPNPRSQPAGPPPEIERIVKYVMNPDGKSAIWTVQMKGQPDNVTQDVDGPFFYETIARKRIWNEYLTDKFGRQQVAEIKRFNAGFAGKVQARKTAKKTLTDDINLSPESDFFEPANQQPLFEFGTSQAPKLLDDPLIDAKTQAETVDPARQIRKTVDVPKPGALPFGMVPVPQNAEALINPIGGSPKETMPFERYVQPTKES